MIVVDLIICNTRNMHLKIKDLLQQLSPKKKLIEKVYKFTTDKM